MAQNAIKTQFTLLYVVNSPTSVLEIGCVSNLTPGGSSRDQIETTCLTDVEKTFENGLGNPGQDTFDIVFSPADTSHQLMETMLQSGDKAQWYVGLSDGVAAPTVAASVITAPAARTGFVFTASVSDVSYAIPGNEVVRATVTLQRSGARAWTYKA